MSTSEFLKKNAPWLAAGGLLTFGSSFGQTYFISIYAGEIRGTFGLSHSAWGGIYAMGTSASAVLMLLVGGLADRFRTRTLAIFVITGLALMCLSMSVITAVWMLPIVIFGLRFCGQGMMSHLAAVSVGRWFAAARGKAISFVHMGFAIGEALLPLTFVMIMGSIGWRYSWMIAAGVVLLFVPIIMLLLRTERSPRGIAEADNSTGMLGKHWTRSMALKHWVFWACLPGLLTQSVFGTAFFFQQVHMTDLKGWPLADFVSLMPLYTVTALFSLFAGGWLVDKFGAGRVLPFYLLPMATGYVIVSYSLTLTGAAIGLFFIGIMHGLSGATIGAFWPEYFGTKYLGSIRAVAMAVMVFASAVGPALTGHLIDAGVNYELQLLGMAAYAVCASILLGIAMWRAPATGSA